MTRYKYSIKLLKFAFTSAFNDSIELFSLSEPLIIFIKLHRNHWLNELICSYQGILFISIISI